MKPKAIFNWSGGKDSALALHRIQQQNQYEIVGLCTTMSQAHQRVTMHGVRENLMQAQAESIGLPWFPLYLPENASLEVYNKCMQDAWQQFKAEGVTHAIFGDIFLEDLRKYREEQLHQVEIKAVFPLWGENTSMLLQEFWHEGFKAKLVCVNGKHLDASFAGRDLDQAFVEALPQTVDPCGENGEYHSFVYDGPVFRAPVSIEVGEVVFRSYAPASEDQEDECFSDEPASFDTGFWFCDLLLTKDHAVIK